VLDRYLGVPGVVMGFGLPDDNLQAPNLNGFDRIYVSAV
jgi:hypothetical protein